MERDVEMTELVEVVRGQRADNCLRAGMTG